MGKEYCVEINSNLNWTTKEEMIRALETALKHTSISVREQSIGPKTEGCLFKGFFNFTPISPEGRLFLCGIECGLGMVIDKIQSPEKIAEDIDELLTCLLVTPKSKKSRYLH
jgi:hypothetical protein